MKGARRVREAARENGTAPTVVTASRADFHRPPQPLIAAFIDDQRAAGHAVESICRVLHEQGCQIAARTYRSWKQPGRAVAARTITDAQVIDAVRGLAWTTNAAGKRVLAPEGLYGRRKMTALIRRAALPEASAGSVHRAMCTLGLQGIRRSKKVRTTMASNCQYLWIGVFQATSVPVGVAGLSAGSGGVMSTGRSSSLPLWNTAPARTRATRCGAFTARQRACAASMSL